ncbi:MAG: TROVE domain-containing protein [Bacteroidota bacterium]
MSKLNPTKKETSVLASERLAGGFGMKAAQQDAYALLRRAVLTCLLWEDLAYESGDSGHMAALIPQVEPQLVAELAIEARHQQKLRHVPLYIASEMLKYSSHRLWVAGVLSSVITRVDMMTDFLAIYWKQGKKPLPAQAKKGLAEAFNRFSEYEFAKYDRNAPIKLRDVMFLVHPKPEAGKEELFQRIANRTLDIPDTWEVAVSKEGNKAHVWERLIAENKLGALAFLRNLRNMKQAGVNHHVVRQGFGQVKSAMLLPLNFFSALKTAPEFERDIESLMLKTYASLPKLKGYTLFVVDVSGSMQSPVSSKSSFSRASVAAAMAVLAANQCEQVDIFATAGSDTKRIHATQKIDYPSQGFGLIAQIEAATRQLGGGGIFTRQCLAHIKGQVRQQPDRIIVFSDSQDCDSSNQLPRPFGQYNYIVDVSAHKRGINYKGVWTAEVSGWSEKFITYISSLEGHQNAFEDQDIAVV